MVNMADAWPALAMLGVLLLLPWGAGWVMKQQGWKKFKSGTQPLHVVSVLAVGPQQKVVTVEVALGPHRKWLVLGVTPQSVTTLDTLDNPLSAPPAGNTHEAIET